MLIGLYVTLDMVFRFDDVVEPPKNAAAMSLTTLKIFYDIVAYYAYQVPLIFDSIGGMIAVVGTGVLR